MGLLKFRSQHQYRLFYFGMFLGLVSALIQFLLIDSEDVQLEVVIEPTRPKDEMEILQNLLSGPLEEDMDMDISSIDQTGRIGAEEDEEKKVTNMGKISSIIPRILCLVLTRKENHRSRAIYVKQTWGKRCNVLIFMSTTNNDPLLPETVSLNVTDGRSNLYQKTRASFEYVYEHYRNEADWFLKADDDTFIILEHLRSFLANYLPEEPMYFGCNFKPFIPQGYMSGGAGYVLSKEALKRYKNGLDHKVPSCIAKGVAEDVQIGRCLYDLEVIAGDSRDEQGSYRFLPLHPSRHMDPDALADSDWYWRYIKYPHPQGERCCSDKAVSFHYISQHMMYTMEYFLYVLRLPYLF